MVIITNGEEIDVDHSSSSLSKTISQESRDLTECFEEEQAQVLVKQMLHNRLFVGHYLERRLVEFLGAYRDVIMIHESEVELLKDLDSARVRLEDFYKNTWIGITVRSTSGLPSTALWVKLQNLPFGQYWFQIKHVKFRAKEINLRLKVIRPLAVADPLLEESKGADETKSRQSSSAPTSSSQAMTSDEILESLLRWKNCVVGEIMTNVVTYATVDNLVHCLCFVAAFLMATLSGMVYGVRFAGEFSLRFLRELTNFLQASTPIILGVIEFMTKVVGGVFILLAMMWKGKANNGAHPHTTFRRQTSTYTSEYVTPYPYRPKPIMPSFKPPITNTGK